MDLLTQLKDRFDQLQSESESLYDFLNRYRDWFNQTVANYELFLEDNWFDGKTTIEYGIRSLKTLDFVVFAEDEYQNWRDTKTWHLGDYVKSYWTVDQPWHVIESFIRQNHLPESKMNLAIEP